MIEAAMLVTSTDFRRLQACANRALRAARDADAAEQLLDGLQRAVVVEASELREPVVALDVPFAFRDLDSGRETTLTLVSPEESDPPAGRVSVLAPLGLAVLGRRTGSVSRWHSPAGLRRVRIERAAVDPDDADSGIDARAVTA